MEINQNYSLKFTISNVSLKIPEKLKTVIESLCRITDRELDDLFSLLIIDQLNYFKEDYRAILQYIKDFEIFNKNLFEGVKEYFNREN